MFCRGASAFDVMLRNARIDFANICLSAAPPLMPRRAADIRAAAAPRQR